MELTIKDAMEMIRNELSQVNNLPPEVLLTAGVHVGRAYGICCDVLNSIRMQEEAAKQQENIVELPLEGKDEA